MSYVDFEYYQTKYGGSLFESEEDFAPYEREAECIMSDAENKAQHIIEQDRKSTRLNSSHRCTSRMPSSA